MYSSSPQGIGSIYVEPVYDTSHVVVSHELLWDELQKEFALHPKISLGSKKSADAILRSHLHTASFSVSGSNNGKNNTEQLGTYNDLEKVRSPAEFFPLGAARRHTTHDHLTLGVHVEIINLRSGTVLLDREYQESGAFQSFDSTYSVERGHSTAFLRNEEGLDSLVKSLSKKIARRVMVDLAGF